MLFKIYHIDVYIFRVLFHLKTELSTLMDNTLNITIKYSCAIPLKLHGPKLFLPCTVCGVTHEGCCFYFSPALIIFCWNLWV